MFLTFPPAVRHSLSVVVFVMLLPWSAGAQPATSNISAGRDFIVAVVDNTPITNHDVQLRARELQQQAQQNGRTLVLSTPLLQEALERLITEKALLQQASDQGVVIDAATVLQAQERTAAQNQLSLEAWRAKLAAQGISPQRWQQTLSDQLTLQRLAERSVPARIRVSDAEVDALVNERMNTRTNNNPNIELAHILVATPERASASELNALQAKAQSALTRLQAGDNFASVAKEVSDSPDKEQGGLMGLRPQDRYPTLFVEATDKLAVGQLSPLLRSGAGFHILKLVTRQNNATMTVTETRARHILLRPGGKLSQNAARAQLAEFKQQLESGRGDFAKLAREHSQDGSAENGGDLGWVAPGVFVPEFEEVMQKLAINQLSDPLISRFGVHLIQVLARRDAPISERELREAARNTLRQRKYEETYEQWAQEVRGRAYVEYRDPPQ